MRINLPSFNWKLLCADGLLCGRYNLLLTIYNHEWQNDRESFIIGAQYLAEILHLKDKWD